MDILTALLFTTTFRGSSVTETVTKLKDMPECRLVINRRLESLPGVDKIYLDKKDAKSVRYLSYSGDMAYQNLNCIDMTKDEKND